MTPTSKRYPMPIHSAPTGGFRTTFASAVAVAAMLLTGSPVSAQQPVPSGQTPAPAQSAPAQSTPAQSAPAGQPQRATVPPPPSIITGPNDETLEPVVTIRKEGDREVEEYRVRGQLFALRVKVKGAAAYWLIDPDGSGRMVPGQGIGPTISVPKWVLKEF